MLVEVKRRGLAIAPELAVGDGALGFWKALEEVYPRTRHQRCWMHKAGNVLDKVPTSVQPALKADLREIHAAPTRAAAEAAVDVFVEKDGAKYPRAAECLTRDRAALLTFYDFPAEHWAEPARGSARHSRVELQAEGHLRTTNPIESIFAVAQSRRRCHVQGRNRGDPSPIRTRRLTAPSPRFPHSSAPETHRFKVYTAGQKRGMTPTIKRQMRRRAAVEPVIGHLKDDHRMDPNYLVGPTGDANNAVLAAVGYNFRRLLAWLRLWLSALWIALNADRRSAQIGQSA